MHLTIAIGILLLSAVTHSARAADATTRPAPPLAWTVQVEPHVSDREAVPLHVRLLAPGAPEDGHHTFLRRGGHHPRLELRDARDGGGGVRRVSFDEVAADDLQRRKVGRHGEAVALHADLIDLFGPIAPGEYRLRVVLPKEAYSLEHRPDDAPADVVSEEVTVTVDRATLEDARRANAPTKDVALRVTNRATDGGPFGATITNHTSTPIIVRAYVEGRGERAVRNVPLMTPVAPETYRGRRGWMAVSLLGWCGTGLGSVTVAPGASRPLLLHCNRGAGIVRFSVPYQIKRPSGSVTETAISDVIDACAPFPATPTTPPTRNR